MHTHTFSRPQLHTERVSGPQLPTSLLFTVASTLEFRGLPLFLTPLPGPAFSPTKETTAYHYSHVLSLLCMRRRQWHPTPALLPGGSHGRIHGAAVHGVAKSQTQLSDFTFTFYFHALEKDMATHSGVLAWRIPGTAEPGGLPSMGSHRVGHE